MIVGTIDALERVIVDLDMMGPNVEEMMELEVAIVIMGDSWNTLEVGVELSPKISKLDLGRFLEGTSMGASVTPYNF